MALVATLGALGFALSLVVAGIASSVARRRDRGVGDQAKPARDDRVKTGHLR
jgi:hypothetical protein